MRSLVDCVRVALAGAMAALMLLATSGGCFAAEQEGDGATLDKIMKLLGDRKQGEVTYVEKDYYGILDQPVRSSGVLVFRAPDHLEKRTLKPRPQTLTVEGDQLTVQRGKRTYHMQLSDSPQVAPLVDAIRDTLNGNEEALRRVFKVDVTGTIGEWRLQLAPLDKGAAGKVREVEIGGARDEIRSVEIQQVGGDHSMMTIAPQ